jgi:AraC family transcriptional regulator of adaptative response / DNA-3-methyladenine glycosylase II
LPGDWIVPDQARHDRFSDVPSDRLNDATLALRAERWRPWRAYGSLYLAMAGLTGADLMERDDDKRAA